VNTAALRDRAAILSAIRRWFDRQGYLEVHTPVLVKAGAMETHLEPVRVPGPHGECQLHTSPEFAMKRVMAEGLIRIYQIVPCFREEEQGVHHSREFTMLEWYRAGAGTAELMDDVEDLIGVAALSVGQEAPGFERLPVSSLISEDLDPDTWFRRWVEEVEPRLTGPVFVHGYPAWQAALARLRDGHADRFEVYLSGIEIGNAFAEETSGKEIRRRLELNNQARKRLGRPPHPVDEDFIDALDRLPRCAGIAVGLDRLVMALCGLPDVAQVQVRSADCGYGESATDSPREH
jgi:lysyl-tRNA synthetase class 2